MDRTEKIIRLAIIILYIPMRLYLYLIYRMQIKEIRKMSMYRNEERINEFIVGSYYDAIIWAVNYAVTHPFSEVPV